VQQCSSETTGQQDNECGNAHQKLQDSRTMKTTGQQDNECGNAHQKLQDNEYSNAHQKQQDNKCRTALQDSEWSVHQKLQDSTAGP
jgi:hypothetical protein